MSSGAERDFKKGEWLVLTSTSPDGRVKSFLVGEAKTDIPAGSIEEVEIGVVARGQGPQAHVWGKLIARAPDLRALVVRYAAACPDKACAVCAEWFEIQERLK